MRHIRYESYDCSRPKGQVFLQNLLIEWSTKDNLIAKENDDVMKQSTEAFAFTFVTPNTRIRTPDNTSKIIAVRVEGQVLVDYTYSRVSTVLMMDLEFRTASALKHGQTS